MNEIGFNLYTTFNLLKHFQATEPRDRIYGILGLFHEQQPTLQIRELLLQPDYQKPIGQVYRDATRAMIEDCGVLEVLHYVDHRHGTLGIPSWVVEFDRTAQRQCGPVCQSTPFNACDDFGFEIIPFQDKNVLACRGFAVDIIAGPPVRIPGRAGFKDGSMARFLQMVKELMQSRRAAFGSDWARQMAFTLSAGIDWKHRAAATAHVEDFLAFMRYVDSGKRCPPESKDHRYFDKKHLEASRWFHSFVKATEDRRLFMTSNGFFVGLGPPRAKEGDVLVVLFGGRVPHILSWKKRGVEFAFVGECYVDGIMFGEQMKKCQKQDPEPFYLA